jgi:hypothetical protein
MYIHHYALCTLLFYLPSYKPFSILLFIDIPTKGSTGNNGFEINTSETRRATRKRRQEQVTYCTKPILRTLRVGQLMINRFISRVPNLGHGELLVRFQREVVLTELRVAQYFRWKFDKRCKTMFREVVHVFFVYFLCVNNHSINNIQNFTPLLLTHLVQHEDNQSRVTHPCLEDGWSSAIWDRAEPHRNFEAGASKQKHDTNSPSHSYITPSVAGSFCPYINFDFMDMRI